MRFVINFNKVLCMYI